MKPKIVKKPEPKPKKQKSQSKRLKTFSSSQFSLWQQKSKAMMASATDLTQLKNDAAQRRAQNNSALSQYASAKGNSTRLPVKKKKKAAPKPKTKVKKIEQQEFEKAKYKESNSQSQIIFSNDETKRQSGVSIKDVKYVHSIATYEYDSNLVLRVNIKKEYVRKVEAATKIQKVFRGFMTRKILMKYVSDEEEKLKGRLAVNSSSDFDEARQNQTHRTFVDRDAENLVTRLFENRAVIDVHFNHEIRPRAQDFSQPSDDEQSPQKEEPLPTDPKQKKAQNWMQAQQQKQQQQEEQENSSQDDEGSNMIYRRQNPIYSQQQISQYLQSSEQDEEYEQELDGYEPEIIFETNQEYIESRKSSLQNKNETVNKLSNKGIADIALLVSGDDKIRKELRNQGEAKVALHSGKNSLSQRSERSRKESRGTEREGKNERESMKKEMKEEAIIEKQPAQKPKEQKEKEQDLPIEAFIAVEMPRPKEDQPQTQPQKTAQNPKSFRISMGQQKKQPSTRANPDKPIKSPRRQIKYLDEQEQDLLSSRSGNESRKSKASVQQKEIIRLREQECEKWEQVIRMVSQQIRKNHENNGEMVNFMKNIMEFSQKNKELLGSTRSVNSESEAFTTPTSMDVYHSVEVKEGSNSVGLPVRDDGDGDGQKNEESGPKFFKKKKPLKIDIVDSNFLRDQRQSLAADKSDSKMQKISQFSFENELQLLQKRKKEQKEEQPAEQNPFQRSKNSPSVPKQKQHKIDYEQSLQKSRTLKKYLASNIQVQDEAVYDILKLREELLQKRESQELVKLNSELNRNQLTQEKFLEKLANLTKKFMQEKETIDKAKEDILKGYQAANNLVKEYFFDVRRMGIKLTVSKSQDNLKYKFSQPVSFPSDIKIDELTPKSTPKSSKPRMPIKQIFSQHEIFPPCPEQSPTKQKSNAQHHSNIESSEDSSIDFTEEELKRFRKAANYDLQFNDLNRNMTTISEDFIKQQRKCFQDEFDGAGGVGGFQDSPEVVRDGRIVVPHRETYMLEEFKVPSSRTPPHVEAIVDNEINRLMWQFACQLMLRPQISQKFLQRPSIIRPTQITLPQRTQFLSILHQNLPSLPSMHQKLNQNITPLPAQILKCMRLDFSQDAEQQEEDENYQEINRYEFVISQEVCAKSVMMFKNQVDQLDQRREIEEIKRCNEIHREFADSLKNTPVAQKIERYINQSQKFLKNKKQHTRQLRWQVMNIELHCIFDSWNQEIIQICSNRCGFSGIGLNELTLSMINHNKPVPEGKCEEVVMGAKEKVLEILADQTDINAKVLRENFHEMCENDSAWIFYADEALSYALELVYLVEEDIYTEMTKELRKIMVKNSLSLSL